MRAVLWGRDQTELGSVAVEPVGDRLAAALSRGLHAKRYEYVDANEDVVVTVAGSRASLLVVADGHNGAEGSEIAVRVVLERLGEDPPPADLADRALVELFWDACEAVRAETAGLGFPRCESRTTLTIALVAGQRVQWAGMGDSPLVVVAPQTQSVTELTIDRPHYVGYPMSLFEVAGRLPRGSVNLDPGDWVVGVTDGFTSFAPLTDLVGILARSVDPAAAALSIIEHAGAQGAGDNVAVALAAPEER